MERDIFNVLDKIKGVIEKSKDYSQETREEYISLINFIKKDLYYKAPELHWFHVQQAFIFYFLNPKCETDWEILSIWTTKSVKELKGE